MGNDFTYQVGGAGEKKHIWGIYPYMETRVSSIVRPYPSMTLHCKFGQLREVNRLHVWGIWRPASLKLSIIAEHITCHQFRQVNMFGHQGFQHNPINLDSSQLVHDAGHIFTFGEFSPLLNEFCSRHSLLWLQTILVCLPRCVHLRHRWFGEEPHGRGQDKTKKDPSRQVSEDKKI